MLIPEQINLYIAEHPEWQRKLMVRLRQLVHAVNDEVEETWRAQSPHFELASMPVLGICASKTSVSVMFPKGCLLYTSDAADERSSVDLGGRRIIKKNTYP